MQSEGITADCHNDFNEKQGRPLLLGDLDAQVQTYIRALCGADAPVSTQIIQAAVAGIVASSNRTLLVENGGHIALSLTRCLC